MSASTQEELAPSSETTIVAQTGDKHTHAVIFLHGREDFGSDLAKYFFDSKSSAGRSLAEIYLSVRWVFPTAKLRYSARRDFDFSNSFFAEALKGAEIIAQRFDIWDTKQPEDKEDLMIPGLQESIGQNLDIVKKEARDVPLERIILGGISQGRATAMLALLGSELDLGEFMGLCSWPPFQKKIESLPSECRRDELSQRIKNVMKMSDENTNTDGDNKELDESLSNLFLYSHNNTSSLAKTPIFLPTQRTTRRCLSTRVQDCRRR